MDYIPLVTPKDIALKNTGKLLVLRIKGKEYEMKPQTLKTLADIAEWIRSVRQPTEWITGYEDMAVADTLSLWPEDKDDLP